jgi:hypothetical protein
MKIYSEIKLENFNAWSGAEVTKSTIIENNKPVHGPPPSLLPTSKSIYKHREQYGEMR